MSRMGCLRTSVKQRTGGQDRDMTWVIPLTNNRSYSGAPYFSAMGAMRFGADLAHVICEPGAGAVIKT